MHVRSAIMVLGVMLPVVPACAQSTMPGPYVAGSAGFVASGDRSVSPSGSHVRTDVGPIGIAGIGYAFANGFRTELEGRYGSEGLRGFGRMAVSGADHRYGFFVDVLKDIDLGGIAFGLTPYIGMGVGYEHVSLDGRGRGTDDGGPGSLRISSSDGSFAIQGIFGASYPIAAIPGLSATVDYRLTAPMEDFRFTSRVSSGGTSTTVRGSATGSYAQSLTFGARYVFGDVYGAPATPPGETSAVPARREVRTYIVFFERDDAELNDRGRVVVAEAAAKSTSTPTTRIDVSGHADATGTPQANMEVSMRRARTVAGELVRNGVPRDVISITAYGSNRPLRPGAASVGADAHDRRVEIVVGTD